MKYFLFSTILILFSCGKAKFSTIQSQDQDSTPKTQKNPFPYKDFINFTEVRPKVDFLFLWDNSLSTKLISPETQQAMANTIDRISRNFDYRMILSPLLYPAGSDNLSDESPQNFYESYIVSENNKYITNNGLLGRWRPPGLGADAIFTLLTPTVSMENGISRAFKLTKAGYSNGIFRPDAHMIIVMLSNGDDRSWVVSTPPIGLDQSNYVDKYAAYFGNLRNIKNLKTLRFLSVVPSSGCRGTKDGSTYRMLSFSLYNLQASSLFKPKGDPGKTPDSFDFCNMQSFTGLFDGINNAITKEIVGYTFNHWPITTNQSWRYDRNPLNVKVYKKDPNGNVLETFPLDPDDGYSFVDGYQTLNIIDCPSHSEITCDSDMAKVMVTGYFIKLNGSAKTSYPNYIDVDTQTPPDFYGYVRTKYEPWINPELGYSESIQIKINGIPVPKGQFEAPIFRENFNVKIKGQSDFTPDTENPLFQTGYFMKLKPAFVFGAGDSVEVNYFPAGS